MLARIDFLLPSLDLRLFGRSHGRNNPVDNLRQLDIAINIGPNQPPSRGSTYVPSSPLNLLPTAFVAKHRSVGIVTVALSFGRDGKFRHLLGRLITLQPSLPPVNYRFGPQEHGGPQLTSTLGFLVRRMLRTIG